MKHAIFERLGSGVPDFYKRILFTDKCFGAAAERRNLMSPRFHHRFFSLATLGAFPVLFFVIFMATLPLPAVSHAGPGFGNVNGDPNVDLLDAVLSLQIIAGIDSSETVYREADVNGDGRIGIEEAIHALRVAAGFPVTVNSLEDMESPPAGTMTLRAALEIAAPGQPIVFDPSLDGGEILLSVVGESHSVLKGEVMGIREEESGPVSYLVGYFDRDYGPSALYAHKDVVIDASALGSGITLKWTGGEDVPARVLAVYGDLTLTNVSITGGRSVTEPIPTENPEDQPHTLGRGGALAVWGKATLKDCRLFDNHCVGDFESSRDRGAFGGGLYADIVDMKNCVVSGNTVTGAGAAGGGVYSVGGAESSPWVIIISRIEQSAVTGNRIRGLFAYGGGVYSDGGGIGNRDKLTLMNSTIAWNVAEPAPDLPPFLLGMGYWRGGGVYMSNGYLHMQSCTVAENEVYGVPRTDDLSKSNLAGGIAATIGNAHAVEEMVILHSIVVGNTVTEIDVNGNPGPTYPHDVFTGSLLHFRSLGHNRFGVLDFSQILVPVGEEDWETLARKHYPKAGDSDGVEIADVLDLDNGASYSDSILSAGVNSSQPVVLSFQPKGNALDRIPDVYSVEEIYAEYSISEGATNNFLEIVLDRIEDHYQRAGFADAFTADFEAYLQSADTDPSAEGNQPHLDPDGNPILTLAAAQWFGPSQTWPSNVANYAYIQFWHRLDEALKVENIPGMGQWLLGDAEWSTLFSPGPLAENGDISMTFIEKNPSAVREDADQFGNPRPEERLGDIGAVELK